MEQCGYLGSVPCSCEQLDPTATCVLGAMPTSGAQFGYCTPDKSPYDTLCGQNATNGAPYYCATGTTCFPNPDQASSNPWGCCPDGAGCTSFCN
jgi:hypothetical protein